MLGYALRILSEHPGETTKLTQLGLALSSPAAWQPKKPRRSAHVGTCEADAHHMDALQNGGM